MQSVVITGATSMLGVALINECISHKTRVWALARPGSINLARIPRSPLVSVVECPLDELDGFVAPDGGRPEVFYHLGWDHSQRADRNNAALQAENIGYTLDAVRLASRLGCRRFVGTGSQAEYGREARDIPPDLPVHPDTAYGAAKYAAGRLSGHAADAAGLEHIWTRVFSVYGIWDNPGTMVRSVVGQLLDGKTPALTAGEQQWDYLFSADAGRALYLTGEKGRAGSVYNIGSGATRPIKEYVAALCAAVGPQARVDLGAVPYAANQVMYLCADTRNLCADTGFRPATDFETGARLTAEWMRGMNQR